MKKIILTFIVIVVIVCLTFAIVIWINMKNACRTTIALGVDKDRVTDYMISLYESYYENTENLKTFVIIKDLETEINEKSFQVTFYAWILTESYSEKNGNIERVARNSIPYKFTLYNTMVEKCELIEKNNLPQNIIDNLPQSEEMELLEKEMEEQVYHYYNHSYMEIIS